jgi:hypothetical protein
MNEPITVTGTVRAWLTSTADDFPALLEQIKTKPEAVVSQLGFSAHDMALGSYPWTEIGTAEITVTLMPRDAVANAQVKTLQAELQNERAESMQRQNRILDRISKLQALTMTVEA